VALTIIHAADVHLDRAFTESGLRMTGRDRRRRLWEALSRIVDLAQEADALCIAGDLYEHEHITRDTQQGLVHLFGDLECPVLLLPGNHDPYVPGSVYERTDWPANVHVFGRSEPELVELTDDIVVWGIAYTGRELRPEVVRRFRAPNDGRTHLLLLHASVIGGFVGAEGDHCPVTTEELAATGAHFVMLGHHHAGRSFEQACYPGSPEPLGWGERGLHAVNRLGVGEGRVASELQPINRLSFEERELDVTGFASSAEVEQSLRAKLAGLANSGRSVRVVLRGETAPTCEVRADQLTARCGEGLAGLDLRDETVIAFDLEAIAEEETVRGRFVRDLLERANGQFEDETLYLDAARAGLRALNGDRRALVAG
jgi:DNA repair exonuclease SbcCD nuclease subunit